MEDTQHDDWTPDPTERPEPESGEQRARRRAVEIAQDAHVCLVTTAATDGTLHTRPMTPEQVTDDLEAWFFVSRASQLAADLATRPRVSLSFEGGSDWLSLSGVATLVAERPMIEELWNPVAASWFPDGPAHPDVLLLKVQAESAEYWKSPGGSPASVLSFLSAMAGRPR